MAVAFDRKSVKLFLKTDTTAQPPVLSPAGVTFTAQATAATAQVTLTGTPGDSLAGWALGFFQFESHETNFARYRGPTVADGSLRVIRDRPPARPGQLCRDQLTSPAGSLWYDPPARPNSGTQVLPGGTVIPPDGVFVIGANHFDQPADAFNAFEPNTLFGPPPRRNFLHSVYEGFQFCTIVVLQEPGGALHFLKHYYWNVRWYFHFRTLPGAAPVITKTDATGTTKKLTVFDGKPEQAPFASAVLTSGGLPICNPVAATAGATPNVRRSLTWHDA